MTAFCFQRNSIEFRGIENLGDFHVLGPQESYILDGAQDLEILTCSEIKKVFIINYTFIYRKIR